VGFFYFYYVLDEKRLSHILSELLNWGKPVGIKALNGVIPSERAFHSSVAMGIYIYMFGGRNYDTAFGDLHIFNTSERSLTLAIEYQ